jgi:hypothetical protein
MESAIKALPSPRSNDERKSLEKVTELVHDIQEEMDAVCRIGARRRLADYLDWAIRIAEICYLISQHS